MVQMMAPMMANHLHGQVGVNLGMGRQGNLYNNLQQQAYLTSHNFLMQQVAGQDRAAARDIIRGVGSMMDVQWTPENEQRADAMAGQFSNVFAPMLLQSDAGAKIYNDVLGGRSRAVMAKYLHMAGRYRNDPIDSGSTLSAFSTDEVSSRLFKDLYGTPGVPGGQDVWKQRTAGLDTYDIGQMMNQMQMRGQLGRNRDFSGLTGNEDTDRGMLAGRESESIKRSLDSRIKSVKAIKEIFGDNGNPNAPWQQLMDALESFTGGSQKITGGGEHMHRIVRNIDNAARSAGVGLNVYGQMLEQTSNRFNALGIDTTFAPLAVTGQLQMRAALMRTDVNDTPAWGLSNIDQLSAQYNGRYAGAARSEVGNFFNTILRLGDNTDAYAIDENTAEGRLFKQAREEMKSGRFGDASEQLRKMDRQEKLNYLQRGFGLSASQAVAQLEESVFANDEYGQRYNTADRVVDSAQRRELYETLGGALGGSNIYSSIQEYAEQQGVRVGNLSPLSKKMSDAFIQSLDGMTSDQIKDTKVRQRLLADSMRAAAIAEGGEFAALLQSDPERANRKLLQMADQQWNTMDSEYKRRNGQNSNLIDFAVLGSTDVRAERARVAERDALRGEIQGELAGMGSDSPLRRFLESVQQKGFDPNSTNLGKSLANAFGVSDDAATQAIAMGLGRLSKEEQKLQAEWDKIDREMPGDAEARKAAIKGKMRAVNEEYNKQMSIFNEKPAMKERYEEIQKQLQDEANGDKPQQVTLNIGNLEINGTVIKDAKGTTKALAKSSQGRGQGVV